MKTYKVLVGDPFGGYSTVESGLKLKAAKKLELEVDAECDYFTTTMIEPDLPVCLFKYNCNYKGEENECLASNNCDLKQNTKTPVA